MKQKKNLENKKGVMLTIDGVIALTLVTVILLVATNYNISAKDDVLPELQLVRTGNDILALLDIVGDIKENVSVLKTSLDILLPPTSEMKIMVNITGKPIIETEEGDMPRDRFIGTGERVFVTEDLEFGIARFWIWAKD